MGGDALDAYYIRGVSHNISFLNALILHPRFREGHLTTNFIAEEYPEGFQGAPASDALKRKLAAEGLLRELKKRRLVKPAPCWRSKSACAC